MLVITIFSIVVDNCKSQLEAVILFEVARVVVVAFQDSRSEQSSASLMQRHCVLESEPEGKDKYDDGCARTGTRLEVTFLLRMVQPDSFRIQVELEELLRLHPTGQFVFTSRGL